MAQGNERFVAYCSLQAEEVVVDEGQNGKPVSCQCSESGHCSNENSVVHKAELRPAETPLLVVQTS
jgi:hypothetical protein